MMASTSHTSKMSSLPTAKINCDTMTSPLQHVVTFPAALQATEELSAASGCGTTRNRESQQRRTQPEKRNQQSGMTVRRQRKRETASAASNAMPS